MDDNKNIPKFSKSKSKDITREKQELNPDEDSGPIEDETKPGVIKAGELPE